MFKVNGLSNGNCDANENHIDRKVFKVEDLMTGQHLAFCPKCFESMVSLRSKGMKPDTADNGKNHGQHHEAVTKNTELFTPR